MSDDCDTINNDPVVLRVETEESTGRGDHNRVVVSQYVSTRPGGLTFENDPHAEEDQKLARYIRWFLMSRFPCGYEWCVSVDHFQGIVDISIPILMGVNKAFRINLRKTAIDTGVLRGAGEILERYWLPRDHFDSGLFLQARQRHSALVLRSRPVPG
jgi:hypothetical protein